MSGAKHLLRALASASTAASCADKRREWSHTPTLTARQSRRYAVLEARWEGTTGARAKGRRAAPTDCGWSRNWAPTDRGLERGGAWEELTCRAARRLRREDVHGIGRGRGAGGRARRPGGGESGETRRRLERGGVGEWGNWEAERKGRGSDFGHGRVWCACGLPVRWRVAVSSRQMLNFGSTKCGQVLKKGTTREKMQYKVGKFWQYYGGTKIETFIPC